MRTDTGKTFRLEDYRPTDFIINHVRLDFRLGMETTRVTALMDLERRKGVDANAPLILDGDDLKLISVCVDGHAVGEDSYDVSSELLTIRDLPKSAKFQLEVVTEIQPDLNKALMGLYVSDNVYCTQCEAEGFRRITYFLDRPDVLATYFVRIEANRKAAPILLSNGNPVASGDLDNGWHFAEWDDPHPKPSYLFALVAGDLGLITDRFVTRSGREVELRIYVEHGKEPRAGYAMDALIRSMKWDEDKFGREYDLDIFMIVAVSSFNMGAMENKGLNVFNDKYVLADPDTATDVDYAGIETVIAHEYFHNWTGNRITCRDWFQLCLKEGLTVYRDHEFSADMRSRAVKRIAEVRALKSNQFPEDQGPLAHPVRPRKYREINNFYTATVYEKGSELVRMIHTIVGTVSFQKGMDLYFDRHDGQAVTIEDFLVCFEETADKDLSQFSQWYHQAGTPTLIVNADWDKAAQTFTLDFEQASKPTPGESRKKLMHIPVKFGFIAPDGSEIKASSVEGLTSGSDVIHVRKKHQRVVFHGIEKRPVPSLLRGFSAPVNLAFEQKAEDRLLLACHDSDLFSRWQALTMLTTETLIDATNALRGKRKPAFSTKLLDMFGTIGTDENLEPAFRALCLTLPQEGDIAREIGSNVDPEAVLAARNALLDAIAQKNGNAWSSLMGSLHQPAVFSPDAASAGKRALRNVVMDYMAVKAGSPIDVYQSYQDSTNMTDRFAALSILVHRFAGSEEASKSLAQFEAKFGDDLLVMDKWFIVQATAPGPNTLAVVQGLTEHKGFSFENPNRMRALVGSFALANPTGFHRADGEAYAFFANFIIRVDKANPQTAARILTAMRSWRSLEPVRKEKARQGLVAISGAPGLSADVRDIVERTLA
ncbi:MAG: aminopeptidase N [Rhizobiaceae bacterium]